MKNIDNTDYLFNDYFENMDLNEDIKKIYEIIDDDQLQKEFELKSKLTKLRNNNHKRYYNIDIIKTENLPEDFEEIVCDIKKFYNLIDYKELLNNNQFEAENNKKIIDDIYRKFSRLDRMIKTTLKELYRENDERQSKFSIVYFNNLDIEDSIRKEVIEKYNNLILYNSVIVDDIYEDIKRQIKRKEYINEINVLLNKEQIIKENKNKENLLLELNKDVEMEIRRYKLKFQYLEDLMIEDSKYQKEFEDFKNFFNKIIAYDDKNFDNVRQTYEALNGDIRFNTLSKYFENVFIKERENERLEEEFVYENFGIKNLRKSLDYISANYIDFLTEEEKKQIEYIFEEINSNKYELENLENILSSIVKKIWRNTITDIHSYNPKNDFYFICSNNQFIDEKYQTILITKKELERVSDYSDYQIGFICEYNNNIMYITENDDIMTVDYNDMSNLKTPIQVEQEFINFKVCNRIALNGYITKISAVYYINDGNIDKYRKAVELSNQYKLPLIELKKN